MPDPFPSPPFDANMDRFLISIQFNFNWGKTRKTCNRLKFLVREMSFRRDKNDVLDTNIGQLGFSERQ